MFVARGHSGALTRLEDDGHGAAVGDAGAEAVGVGDGGGVARQLGDVVQHGAVRGVDRGAPVVLADHLDQPVIQGHPTQKLCV